MEIKYKLYPYPVLSSFSNDYKTSSFDVAINILRDGYDIRINFDATLTDAVLLNYIKNGDAKFVYHLECAQTGFRTVIQTDKFYEFCTLSNKVINGRLQICPFIIATDSIIGYTNTDFHDDYQGISFDIEAGCVMAVGKMVTADITKDIDDLANTPSIFSIIRNANTTVKEMLIDMGQRKIIIKLPFDDYYSYKQMSKTPQAQPILNSMTVLPALIYVLEELKMMSIGDREENTDSLWYRVLSKTLLSTFDCDIESEEYNSTNSVELAQKLINNPISDAFHILTTSFGDSGGDEES